jgi:hypothetical protein
MQPALTVSQLTAFLREILEANEYLWDLWVVGEISNFSRPSSGHRYFSLKDAGGVLRCVLSRDDMPARPSGRRPRRRSRVGLPQRGELSSCVISCGRGVGILAALRAEEAAGRRGLFDPARKRPLPPNAWAGDIADQGSAAVYQNVLARQWPLAALTVAPAVGRGRAAPRIVAACTPFAAGRLTLRSWRAARAASKACGRSTTARGARAVRSDSSRVRRRARNRQDDRGPGGGCAHRRRARRQARDADIGSWRGRCARPDNGLGSTVGSGGGRRARERRPHAHATEHPRPGREGTGGGFTAAGIAAGLGGTARLAGRGSSRQGAWRGWTHATLARGFAIVQDASTRKVVNSVRRAPPGHIAVSVADGTFFADIG